MSLNTLFKAVAGVLALSAGLAFTPVGAQTATAERELISTTCAAGNVTKCGTRATDITCGWSVGITPIPGLTYPGLAITKTNCTAMSSYEIYKDFWRSKSGTPTSGVCVAKPQFPTDPNKDESAAAVPTDESGEC